MEINAIVVFAYMLSMVFLGIYLMRYVKKDEDFFLAGRSLNHWVIAGTIMATNVAAIYLVGPAGASYAGGGVSVLLIAWTGNMLAALSALFFVPRLRRLRITTVSEFLETRYGIALRLLPSALWIIYYALFSGNAIYTLSTVLSPVLNLNVNTIILFAAGGVIIYCFLSGLIAAAYSSVLQSFLMILGGLILLPLCIKEVGGLSAFATRVPPDYFVFWKSGEVWPTTKDIIMFILLGLPYWCTSQYMLQRSFAGRSVRDASRGLTLAALMTGPLTLSYIIPGICAVLIFGQGGLDKTDTVLPRLLHEILPVGLGGLFIAALVAASNSTASALLNSLATLTEHDFYRRFLPDKSSRHYVWVGRIATLVGGLLGLTFAFNVEKLGGIIQANFEIMSFFEPPIFVIVAAALFWRRTNAWGAGAGVIGGVLFNAIAAYYLKWSAADRTLLGLPIAAMAMVLGTFLGNAIRPRSEATLQKVDEILAKTRGLKINFASPVGRWGIAIAVISLLAFVGCSVFESALPKPGNILIFMGLMMTFVIGCYLAIPVFVPEEREEEEIAEEEGSIQSSWIHKSMGSGWSWLALYVLAGILILILYSC